MKLGIFVLDIFNNLMATINSVFVKVTVLNVNSFSNQSLKAKDISIILENSIGKIENGAVLLKELAILSNQSEVTTKLKVTIDVMGNNLESSLEIRLIRCKKGEVFRVNRFITWPPNFYSLVDDSYAKKVSDCQKCPLNAECPGGEKIIPMAGFWRKDAQSSHVLKCLNEEACPLSTSK